MHTTGLKAVRPIDKSLGPTQLFGWLYLRQGPGRPVRCAADRLTHDGDGGPGAEEDVGAEIVVRPLVRGRLHKQNSAIVNYLSSIYYIYRVESNPNIEQFFWLLWSASKPTIRTALIVLCCASVHLEVEV